MFDFSIFATTDTWITLISLMFLEVVLGVDNLVFISLTTDRLPQEKQHLGRKLGLGAALVMRIVFLSLASFLVHMTDPFFTVELGSYTHGFSVRDLILLAGGAYLIYKGISELRSMLSLTEVKAEQSEEHRILHTLSLPQAIATIMVMDVVFSIDSVITAVGMADYLIVMVLAVMFAVLVMMIFIDAISNFINTHPEIKMLALVFIVAIGCLLVIDATGFHTDIEILHMSIDKLMVYFAMVFCIVLELVQMRYRAHYAAWRTACMMHDAKTRLECATHVLAEQLEGVCASHFKTQGDTNVAELPTSQEYSSPQEIECQPLIVGNAVYMVTLIEGLDPESVRKL